MRSGYKKNLAVQKRVRIVYQCSWGYKVTGKGNLRNLRTLIPTNNGHSIVFSKIRILIEKE